MTRRSVRGSRNAPGNARWILLLLVVGLFLVLGLCCGTYAVISRLLRPDGGSALATPVPETALTVAYSPEKEIAFNALVDGFNAAGDRTPEGEPMRVVAVQLDPESMVNAALEGNAPFQAMTPDSSVWLGQLDEAWRQQLGSEDAQLVGETVRYAVSPVVIAMWEDLAREMGWPGGTIGWEDLLARAQTDPNFRWSHPSTSSASGLLATLAEFYAGAGKTRGLTIEDVQAQSTLDYVAALESTVRYYGEGNEPAIIDQALREGRNFLDAFVVQEQMVVYYNTHRQAAQQRLVAIYPAEGALWEDHPLALLETAGLTTYQRQVFASFRDYLLSPEAQQLILRHGYRPADLSIALDGSDSPLTADNGVNPAEPKTALQVPNASVIGVVRNVWWYTKRHTNVYLVVDTSGSMRGEKLAQAQEALRIFLGQIQGDLERVGMVQFSSSANVRIHLDELGNNRAALEREIDTLEAGGDTALLDAVYVAFQNLQELGDTERINAIVVMTDGQENNSSISLRTLVRRLQSESRVPVVVFCIAYGADADMATLQAIAEPTGGQVREGNLENIRDLYKLLSTYFWAMAKTSFHEELERKAGRAILIRSIYRWESAAIIALTAILAFLVPEPLPFWQVWFWLILGAVGEVGLVWSSIKDPEFRARAVAEMFHEKFNSRQIKNKALRQQVDRALEYRDRIDEVIGKSREGVLRDHLQDVSQGITDWMENVFRLARRLDSYEADEMLRQDMQTVEPAIETLKKRLALEDDDTVKRQISQAIAQRQIQRDNLRKLQNVMEQAQFQLESTLTAMGTVYSQMMILGSRDVASGRAQRLQQDIADQVQALQDVVHTMDEVYQAGTDPLGLGLSAADLQSLNAGGQAAKKGLSGN